MFGNSDLTVLQPPWLVEPRSSRPSEPGSRKSPGEDTAHIPRKHLCLALPGNAARERCCEARKLLFSKIVMSS